MQISTNKLVTMGYTLSDEHGNVIDSSRGGEPFTYLHGTGGIIPGLERALEGRSAGETFSVTIAPEDGYGHRNEALIEVVPLERFEDPERIEVGMQFQAQTPEGVRIFSVIGLEGGSVTIDGNHPLAGATLRFDIEVLKVDDLPEEARGEGD